MAILNNYKKWKHLFTLALDKYYDFVLSRDDTPSIDLNSELTEDCLSCYIDLTNKNCVSEDSVLSLSQYNWEKAVNNGADLLDIGLTGIDNGLILYDKNTITFDEFYNYLTKSEFIIDSGDTRLYLNKVSGNTKQYTYDCEYNSDGYYQLKGGFLQGFFKIFGFDYQILPTTIEDEWNFEFVIRPKDYEEKQTTLNNKYPNNKGIFFYIGTRAENKFGILYNDKYTCVTTDGIESPSDDVEDYFLEEETETICKTVNLSNGEDTDSNPKNKYSITTDNKFLIFNRTKSGLTVNTYEDDTKITISGDTHGNVNLFPLMNRTKSGLTVNTLEDYYQSLSGTTSQQYDLTADTLNNSFALKVNEDGSISYRYLIKDCDADEGYSIKEETSFPNIITKDEWNVITVKIKILNNTYDSCGNVVQGNRKMKLFIYVNGYLKMVSKELPEFDFKELSDDKLKQECVPFNISLGGGTLGLAEMVWLNYKDLPTCESKLAENFAGSFIGDIKSFKFYTCQMQYTQIKNNYLFETK